MRGSDTADSTISGYGSDSQHPQSLSDDDDDDDDEGVLEEGAATPTLHVKFAPDDQVKSLTPSHEQTNFTANAEDHNNILSSPSSPDSGTATPNSDDSLINSPIAKTLASRLSFWTRLSKRTSGITTSSLTSPLPESSGSANEAAAERVSFDSLLSNIHSELDHTHPITVSNKPETSFSGLPLKFTSPSEALSSIVTATAPPPPTAKERKSELEDKIVKETVKEFTKGGMYFAYNFGTFLDFDYTCFILLK